MMALQRGLVLASILLCSAHARVVSTLDGPWRFTPPGAKEQAEVRVPHTWNAVDGADGIQSEAKGSFQVDSVRCDAGYLRGTGEYAYEAGWKPQKGKRYFLRLEGASINSEVLINGQSLGKHEGAFTASCYELTSHLKPEGRNELRVLVDNSMPMETAPLGGDFTMFGGLYRPVRLIETDALCIDPLFYASSGVRVRVTCLSTESAQVEVTVRLNGKAATGRLVVDILSPEGECAASAKKELTEKAGEIQEHVLTLAVPSPRLWNGTKDAALYRVRTTLETEDGQTDSVTEPLGFRSIAFSPHEGFILNGEPMQLRGVSRHQDKQGKGWAISPEDEEEDVQLMKEMGVNAVRTAHYPQSEHFYNLADAAGFVVWTEVPCVNQVRDTEAFRSNVAQQAKEMIYQLGNHPGICMWGIFNEIYHQIDVGKGMDMEKVLRELNALVKETDPSRDTVGASNQQHAKSLNRIPDHIAFNVYPGWYGGPPTGMNGTLDRLLADYGDRCVGVSEYGHGAGISTHQLPCKQPRPLSPFHPEEWQAYAHGINYDAILKRPRVWGAFIWNMFDFGSDARGEGESHGINDKGLVTYDRRTRKDAFYFYKAQWNPSPMVYITSRRYVNREQNTTDIKVYANVQELHLSVNGTELPPVKPDALHRAEWKNVRLQHGVNCIRAWCGETSDSIEIQVP